ncbi:MAG: hypothetical protein LBF77_03485 [Spirochaetaceae bacterium]|jgi:hypothetical protein|nr:hypothetical protein [Spirochaetaceae bacterium]
MDTGETWYISSTAISINNTASSRRVSLQKQPDRVIEATEGGRKYYFYASRTANASFTGRVATLEKSARSARAVGGVGGIGVTISNLKDKA